MFPGRGEALRLVLLSAHYRQPLDFSLERVRDAERALDRLCGALRSSPGGAAAGEAGTRRVAGPLLDDLNTPGPIAALHAVAGEINAAADPAHRARLRAELVASGAMLGLLGQDPEACFRKGAPAWADDTITELVAERGRARASRDFDRADAIRRDLGARGILLEDGPGRAT